MKPLVLLAVALLAGCGGGGGKAGRDAPAAVQRQADPGPCGAATHGGLRGQPLTALPGDEIPGTMRIILPGETISGDFNPMRLNVSLGVDNRIAALSCG